MDNPARLTAYDWRATRICLLRNLETLQQTMAITASLEKIRDHGIRQTKIITSLERNNASPQLPERRFAQGEAIDNLAINAKRRGLREERRACSRFIHKQIKETLEFVKDHLEETIAGVGLEIALSDAPDDSEPQMRPMPEEPPKGRVNKIKEFTKNTRESIKKLGRKMIPSKKDHPPAKSGEPGLETGGSTAKAPAVLLTETQPQGTVVQPQGTLVQPQGTEAQSQGGTAQSGTTA